MKMAKQLANQKQPNIGFHSLKMAQLTAQRINQDASAIFVFAIKNLPKQLLLTR